MSSQEVLDALEAFKSKRRVIKGNLTKYTNLLAKELAKLTPERNVVQAQGEGAKLHWDELKDEFNKFQAKVKKEEDNELLAEGAKYVEEQRSVVDKLLGDIKAFLARTPEEHERLVKAEMEKQGLIKEVEAAKVKVREIRLRLEGLIKGNNSHDVVAQAGKDLEAFQDKMEPALQKLILLLTGTELANLLKWEKENRDKIKNAFAWADDYLEQIVERNAETERAIQEASHRCMVKMDHAVESAIELDSLEKRNASKNKMRRALKLVEAARSAYTGAHQALLKLITGDAAKKANESYLDTVVRLDASVQRGALNIQGRPADEPSNSTVESLHEERMADVDGQTAEAVKRQEDVKRSPMNITAATPPGFYQPVLPEVKMSSVGDYVMKARPFKRHWIEDAVAKGCAEPEAKYANVRSSVKAELTTFMGDADDWDAWSSLFQGLVHNSDKTPHEKLALLRKYMSRVGKFAPFKIVQALTEEEDYLTALDLLHREYGDPHEKRIRLRLKLQDLEKVPPKDSDRMTEFSYDVRGLLAAMSKDPFANVEQVLDDLAKKLPFEESINWQRIASAVGTNITFGAFSEYVSELARLYRKAKEATPKSKAGAPAAKIQANRSGHSVSSGAPKTGGFSGYGGKGGGFNGVGPRVSSNTAATTVQPLAAPTGGCGFCGQARHPAWMCHVFKDADVSGRKRLAAGHKPALCFVCLGPGHKAQETEKCRWGTKVKPCGKCDGRHNYLLHPEGSGPQTNNNLVVISPNEEDGNTVTVGTLSQADVGKPCHNANAISLGLANVKVIGKKGGKTEVSLMADNGSTATIMLEEFAQKKGLIRGRGEQMIISGAGGTLTTCTSYPVSFEIETQEGKKFTVNAVTCPKVTGVLDPVNWAVEKNKFEHLRDLPLKATSNRPVILLGVNDSYLLAAQETRRGQRGDPYAEYTELGWIARGPVHNQFEQGKIWPVLHMNHMSTVVEDRAPIFYESEAFGTEHQNKLALSADDQLAYKIIEEGIQKLPDEPGYSVKLPWRPTGGQGLKDNRRMAESRLRSLRAKLMRNRKDLEDYCKSMEAYLKKGFARVMYKYDPNADPNQDQRSELGQYFLAHQGVRKRHGGKLRVVFDASAEAWDGSSLNKALFCGPKLQTDIPDVLIRWREDDIAYAGDIVAMFSQIRMSPEDARKHRFLWQFPGEDLISVLQMDRVAFGDGPSPCLAIATVHRTADDFGKDEELVEIIKNGFYVDDLLDSASTVEEANRRAKEIASIMANGSFEFSGWRSNAPGFNLMTDDVDEAKVLGMRWNVKEDVVRHVSLEDDPNSWMTLRWPLSRVAGLYSPLGLASPLVIKAKIRLAQLHTYGLGWDESLLTDHADEAVWWKAWLEQVPRLCEVPFPRCLRPRTLEIVETELHTFTDASEEAFAAAVYVRNIYKDGSVQCNLVEAKTKVRPRKVISVAKMELQGALLGARLASHVTRTLRFPVSRRYFWTDSSCTRQWVRSTSSRYMAFVANRVGEIQTLTEPHEWRHVPGKLNVADIATRDELVEDGEDIIPEIWIRGPDFLYEDKESWPKDISYEQPNEEMRPKFEMKNFNIVVQKGRRRLRYEASYFSNYTRLLRVRAWWHRAARRVRLKLQGRVGELPDGLEREDLERARIGLLREAQEQDFGRELAAIKEIGVVAKKSKLAPLTPFLDSDGLIRAGGRFTRAKTMSYDERHPVILTPSNPLTKSLINYTHRVNNHATGNHLHAILRQRYHILHGRSAVKRIFCRPCHIRKARPGAQLMAELPAERLAPYPPFYHTSMDYFGYYWLRYGANKSKKHWVCLFTCMVTRAVHLELCESLKHEDFLLVFRTFCNLRGQPRILYTDNGTNFTGAERQIREELLLKDVIWKFQPSNSPHWGGVHEALVKSAKAAMDKAIEKSMRRRRFTEMEFRALLAEVTGFLNGRPLTYQSSQAGDGIALTPNHFLLQRPGMVIPDERYRPTLLGDHFDFVQATADEIWKLWQSDYLPTLLARTKWRFRDRNLCVDDVVLVVDDVRPRNQWSIGWITKVFPGKNGCVRAAMVRTAEGEYERPIVRLCLLEAAPDAEEPLVDVAAVEEDLTRAVAQEEVLPGLRQDELGGLLDSSNLPPSAALQSQPEVLATAD